MSWPMRHERRSMSWERSDHRAQASSPRTRSVLASDRPLVEDDRRDPDSDHRLLQVSASGGRREAVIGIDQPT
jgi:hypothetical protein